MADDPQSPPEVEAVDARPLDESQAVRVVEVQEVTKEESWSGILEIMIPTLTEPELVKRLGAELDIVTAELRREAGLRVKAEAASQECAIRLEELQERLDAAENQIAELRDRNIVAVFEEAKRRTASEVPAQSPGRFSLLTIFTRRTS